MVIVPINGHVFVINDKQGEIGTLCVCFDSVFWVKMKKLYLVLSI